MAPLTFLVWPEPLNVAASVLPVFRIGVGFRDQAAVVRRERALLEFDVESVRLAVRPRAGDFFALEEFTRRN